MLRFLKAIKIKVLCDRLVEIHYYDVSKKVDNPKWDNVAILVWKINLVEIFWIYIDIYI